MKRILVLVLLVGVASGGAFAQAAKDVPATKEDVEKLFATMHLREQMHNMIDVMSKQWRQMGKDSLKKKLPGITEKDLDRYDEMTDGMLKQVDFDGMIEDMLPVYQHHLTEEDIGVMAAFYQTPTGQKMLREQPQMTAEAMKAVQPRMEKMMTSVMNEAEKMAREAAAESKPTNVDKN